MGDGGRPPFGTGRPEGGADAAGRDAEDWQAELFDQRHAIAAQVDWFDLDSRSPKKCCEIMLRDYGASRKFQQMIGNGVCPLTAR
jgi:hypothetical protein